MVKLVLVCTSATTDAQCLQGKDVANQNKRKFLADVLGVVSIALNEPIACDVREVSSPLWFASEVREALFLAHSTQSMQVVKGRDAAGVNKLLQMLATASDVLQLDGVEALRVRHLVQCTSQQQKPCIFSRCGPWQLQPCFTGSSESRGSAG